MRWSNDEILTLIGRVVDILYGARGISLVATGEQSEYTPERVKEDISVLAGGHG